MKIIVTERIAEEGIDFLRNNEFEVDVKYGISRDELLGNIGDYDAISRKIPDAILDFLHGRGRIVVLHPHKNHCVSHRIISTRRCASILVNGIFL